MSDLYKNLSIVDHIGDVVSAFDWIDALEGAIFSLRRAQWRKAWRKAGVFGVVAELGASVLSFNSPTIRVSRMTGWRGIDTERLLRKYGVRIGGRGATSREIFFQVAERQVKWAEYILLRAGAPVTSVLKESRNTGWAQARRGAPIPQGWGDK